MHPTKASKDRSTLKKIIRVIEAPQVASCATCYLDIYKINLRNSPVKLCKVGEPSDR